MAEIKTIDGKKAEPRAEDLEMIVTCKHCHQMLWEMKVLSHRGGKPMSTQWRSLNPEFYPHGAPSGWDCPLCEKEFAKKTVTRPGLPEQWQIRVVHKDIIRWI